MFYLIFCLFWFVLSTSTRELTRNSSCPIWWKKILTNVIVAPSLLGEYIAWHRLGGIVGTWLAVFASWLTR